MNELGRTELKNNDNCLWVCKDDAGGVQILLWNFTNTHPGDSVNNQVYYVRDLPAKSTGKIKLRLTGLPAGKYQIK